MITCISRLSPEISAMRIICPVTVVPMFAPMMTPTACESPMIPEFTSPMTMTMVAAEDCSTPVMSVPSSTPRMGEEISFCSTVCILPLAIFSRPEPMMLMPYRNSAMPPARLIASKMVIAAGSPFTKISGACAHSAACRQTPSNV